MEKILVVIPSHNTISTKGEGILEKSIDSLVKSYRFLTKQYPHVRMNCAIVDDASTDGTYEKITEIINAYEPNISELFEVSPIGVNKGAAFCRNYAASLKNFDYICFLDSDDEMYENHLTVCYQLMQQTNPDGKMAAVGITKASFDEKYDIHESWKNHLSIGFPMTKIIRKEAWDFIEGFPINDVFKVFGGEDFHFIRLLQEFFQPIFSSENTIKYNIYQNSTMEKRIEIYKKPLSEHDELLKGNTIQIKEYKKTLKIQKTLFKNNLEYLEFKFKKMGHAEKFADFALNPKVGN